MKKIKNIKVRRFLAGALFVLMFFMLISECFLHMLVSNYSSRSEMQEDVNKKLMKNYFTKILHDYNNDSLEDMDTNLNFEIFETDKLNWDYRTYGSESKLVHKSLDDSRPIDIKNDYKYYGGEVSINDNDHYNINSLCSALSYANIESEDNSISNFAEPYPIEKYTFCGKDYLFYANVNKDEYVVPELYLDQIQWTKFYDSEQEIMDVIEREKDEYRFCDDEDYNLVKGEYNSRLSSVLTSKDGKSKKRYISFFVDKDKTGYQKDKYLLCCCERRKLYYKNTTKQYAFEDGSAVDEDTFNYALSYNIGGQNYYLNRNISRLKIKWKIDYAIFSSVYGKNQVIAENSLIDDELVIALDPADYVISDNNVMYFENNDDSVYRWVAGYVDSYYRDDLFSRANLLISILYGIDRIFFLLATITAIMMVISYIYILKMAGHVEGTKEIVLNKLDKVPVLVTVFAAVAMEYAGLGILVGLNEKNSMDLSLMISDVLAYVLTCIFMVVLFLIFSMTIAVRVKTKTLFKLDLAKKLFSGIKKTAGLYREKTSLMVKTTLILIIVVGMDLIFLSICNTMYRSDFPALFLIYFLIKMVEVALVIVGVLQMEKLQLGSKNIAEGNLAEKIDTSKMFWEFKKHGENINSIGVGMEAAVQEQMKSERFRTELITNVSHDIKTPLTSIINYVDLIKKEKITEEPMVEYIDVLDRQSARLKKLIEDLMEASKASTGNLSVQLEECDAAVFLGQIAGEFDEKLATKNLELVITDLDMKSVNKNGEDAERIFILADGRHLWRVFDNLLNNICKYALPGTRVYVDLGRDEDKAVITFKNISAYKLNISSEELMERFVRGDSSRNTEGSGLGLSITQSLTLLMNGEMKLDIDGDLFKVTLRFPIFESESSE